MSRSYKKYAKYHLKNRFRLRQEHPAFFNDRA